MAWTDQSEGWYKFPPLWFGGTEVSCRGQFRIAAMSVTAVLEGHVLSSRPVTLLYAYLPCSPLSFFSLSLSVSRFSFLSPHRPPLLFTPLVSPFLSLRSISISSSRPISRPEAPPRPQPTSQIIIHVMGHAHRIEPTGNNKVEGGLSRPIYRAIRTYRETLQSPETRRAPHPSSSTRDD